MRRTRAAGDSHGNARAADVLARLQALGNARKARLLAGFFKTGPGEYGAGDRFLGLNVPTLRALSREFIDLPDGDVQRLLRHPIHEARLLALLLLVHRFERGDAARRAGIFRLYFKNRRWVNNWDLVDLSAPQILGGHLAAGGDRALLDRLARSPVLWDRRMAVLATHCFIRKGAFAPMLRIARILLHDQEDLIHKAVGWMLREIGKRDREVEEAFLRRHYAQMPRTMLRYAIERFPPARRRAYLRGAP